MKYSEQAQRNLIDLYNKYSHLSTPSSPDGDRRTLTGMIIQQNVFDEPHMNYGWKSRDSNAEPSKDTMAQLLPDGTMNIWDLFDGETRKPNTFPESAHLTDQHFIQVEGVNHLGHNHIGNELPPHGVVVTDEKPVEQNQADLNDIEDYLMTIIHNQELLLTQFNILGQNLMTAVDKLTKDGIPVRFGR